MGRKIKILQRIALTLCMALCVGYLSGFISLAASTITNNFTVTDVRNSNKQTTFNGQDNEYSIILFGGVGSCFNTTSTLKALNELTNYADMNTLNIYAFDIKSNTADSIRDCLEENNISDRIFVSLLDSNAQNLYRTCFSSTISSGSFTMPLVVYKNPSGEIFKYTTSLTTLDTIVNNLRAGGYPIDDIYDYYDIPISVTFKQEEARSMFSMINDFRTGNDAWYWASDNATKVTTSPGALTYDYELEKVAMQRAVELALLYSHTRPNGTDCFTAYTEINPGYLNTTMGENIAMGYTSAESVFDAWREDNEDYSGQGHRRNMLGNQFNAVGFGCVYYDGVYYWAQEFSSKNLDPTATVANNDTETQTVNLRADNILTFHLINGRQFKMSCGQTVDLSKYNVGIYVLSDSSYIYSKPTLLTATPKSSSDSKIVKIQKNKLTATSAGSATITLEAFGLTSDSSVTVSHVWNDGTVTKNPTFSSTGVRTYTCNGCNATKTESIDKLSSSGLFAIYEGYYFVNDGRDTRCYYEDGTPIINDFKCDGTYTYYFQADGTAMKNRLTYHPDGEHVIYFDEYGHEVFSDFANVKKTIAGDAVDDYCFFDVYGYLYVDVVTYDKTGTYLYYANPYGVMDRGKWFEFSDTAKWADGTPFDKAGGKYGYANADGTLMTNQWTTDWEGRDCYMQGNGVAIYP